MALLSVAGETVALLPVASGKSLAADFGRLIGEMLLLEDIAARATRRGLQTKRRRPTHASQHLRNESISLWNGRSRDRLESQVNLHKTACLRWRRRTAAT